MYIWKRAVELWVSGVQLLHDFILMICWSPGSVVLAGVGESASDQRDRCVPMASSLDFCMTSH